MLIRFKVQNFRSFGNEVEFSCLATPERGHRKHILTSPQPGLRLLPVAAIYGANASGKSNLYRAVEFARKLVVSGVKLEFPIAVEPFRLDLERRSAPARFCFEVLVKDQVLCYRFAVDREKVVEESLTECRPASEHLLFLRDASSGSDPKWDWEYFKSLGLKAEELQFIEFVAKGTPKNQLFLREAHARNVKHFEQLWRWFRHSLLLIDPQTTSSGLEFQMQEQGLKDFSTRMLHGADMGIDRLGTELVSLESLDLPRELRQRLENECKEGQSLLLRSISGHRLNLRRENGELKVAKLVSYHRTASNSEEVAFDIGEESDGTQRVVDLLPAFHDLANASEEFVVFVDEIDRSLHSRLTRALIEGYLSCRPENARSQLLFTTHDATLLDQALFRRDEVWFIEKNEKGESELSSLGDYKLRGDKRLMKDYLLGRFGGVPRVHRLPLRPAAAAIECNQGQNR
jgi:AAA15 family ATPase/GTPase